MSETAQQNAAILADFQMHKLDRHLAEIARLRAEVGPKPRPDRASADLVYRLNLEVQRLSVVADDISWHFARAARESQSARRPAKAKPVGIWDLESIVSAAGAWHRTNGRPPMADEWRIVDPTGARPTVSQVLSVFGKWNAMLEAAGFSKRTGGRGNISRPLTEEQAA